MGQGGDDPKSSEPLIALDLRAGTTDKGFEPPDAKGSPTDVLETAKTLELWARDQNRQLTLVNRGLDIESKRQLAKRRHDVKGSLRTLNLVVQALLDGYKFDDGAAKAKVEAIKKAVQLLEKEQPLLLQVLGEFDE